MATVWVLTRPHKTLAAKALRRGTVGSDSMTVREQAKAFKGHRHVHQGHEAPSGTGLASHGCPIEADGDLLDIECFYRAVPKCSDATEF